MADGIPHFNLNFDFLYTQANDNEIRNENGQIGEKEQRFPDLTEEQRDRLLVDVEAKAQLGCKSFLKVGRYTNRHIIDHHKLKEKF